MLIYNYKSAIIPASTVSLFQFHVENNMHISRSDYQVDDGRTGKIMKQGRIGEQFSQLQS